MNKLATGWVVLLALTAGCATTANMRGPENGVYYQSVSALEMGRRLKSPSDIRVFREGVKLPFRPFRVIGRIVILRNRYDYDLWVASMNSNSYTFVAVPVSTEKGCFKILQEEAAKRGGDAVIHVTYEEHKAATWGRGERYSGPRAASGYKGEVIVWEKGGQHL